jgi:DNA repair protein RadA/Sms
VAKVRVHFLCNQCGSSHAKWFGKCPDCGTWDSLEEYRPPTEDARDARRGKMPGDAEAQALRVSEISRTAAPRLPTGIGEFDRVLGGGIVPGSAVLIGGEPGIGKSTLLLQVAHALAGGEVAMPASIALAPAKIVKAKPRAAVPVLYVTSEESASQIAMRATRLHADAPELLVLAESNVQRIIGQIQKQKPAVVIIDSIQMIYQPDLPAAPGSLTQLRGCCMDLVVVAKSTGAAVIFVGHVTKAGTLAGPKVIEHIVDAVAYFEGDRFHAHRLVRCAKNRFGGTHEVGIFEMTESGLTPVTEPGNLFLPHNGANSTPPSGTVIAAAMQGSRVLLVEVQALTASSVIGSARRKVSGASSDRVAMIVAVLEKRAELRLAADDVFVNIAGGVKVAEPAVDLAIALAIISAHMNRPSAQLTLAIGELGLGGEIRSVSHLEQRLREAARLGLGHAIVPKMGGAIPKLSGMALHEVTRLSQASGIF